MPRKPRLFVEHHNGLGLTRALADLTGAGFHNQNNALIMAANKAEASERAGAPVMLWDGFGDHHAAIRDAFPMVPGRFLTWSRAQAGNRIVEVLEDGTGVIVGAWRYDDKTHRLVVDVIPAGVE